MRPCVVKSLLVNIKGYRLHRNSGTTLEVRRRGEASSRHSRQSDSEASGIMYRRRRRAQDPGMRRSGEQRRSLEDLRSELTEELRFQQAMFLSARDQLAGRTSR